MAKIELTKEQTALYNELKRLSKTANQRILQLERTFGKDTWRYKIFERKA